MANSGQDTITVLDVAARKLVGHVDLRKSLCNAPDKARTFQPRGMAVTKNSKRLFVTRFLSVVKPGGVQADDNGREGAGLPPRHQDRLDAARRLQADQARQAGARRSPASRSTPTATAWPTRPPAFPNQLQSIVIKGNNAYLPNIAASPSGPLRFNVDTHAFVNVIGGVNTGSASDQSAAKFLNLHLGARNPEPGKKKLFFANVWRHRLREGQRLRRVRRQRPAGEDPRRRRRASSTSRSTPTPPATST